MSEEVLQRLILGIVQPLWAIVLALLLIAIVLAWRSAR